ncbi:MAG: hypothetical protein Ta2B_00750 [Termitinemataceae bacterium]|nr:MAG: hypothetical protein Ta2B_00750 [Termitinemataceae bacterium]
MIFFDRFVDMHGTNLEKNKTGWKMKIVKILFYVLGLLVSVAFLIIEWLIDESWIVVGVMFIAMSLFCALLYFVIDRWIDRKNLKYVYIFSFIATITAGILCFIVFLKNEYEVYVSASSESIYIPLYVSTAIYMLAKEHRIKELDEQFQGE